MIRRLLVLLVLLTPSPAWAVVSVTGLTSNFDVTGATTSTTASVTPPANHLVTVDILSVFVTVANAADPTLSGTSLSWTKVASVNNTTAGVNLIRFRALGASPGSGALTITHAATVQFAGWSVQEFSGIDTGGTNGANAIVQTVPNSDISGATNTITVTLAAFGSVNNATSSSFGWFNVAPLPTATPDTGWAEVHEQGSTFSAGTLAGSIETQFIASNDTSAVVLWTGNGGMFALASEIKAAAAGGATSPPPCMLRLLGVGCDDAS